MNQGLISIKCPRFRNDTSTRCWWNASTTALLWALKRMNIREPARGILRVDDFLKELWKLNQIGKSMKSNVDTYH